MMVFAVPALAALVAAAAGPQAGQGGDAPLTVSAVRFYAPGSATTTIEGVCEVRLGSLFTGSTTSGRYRFSIAVLDSSGLVLQTGEWTRDLPATVVRSASATSVESFSFRAAPGSYRVRIRAVPEAGRTVEREVAVSAFAVPPPMSDLLLATSVRLAADSVASLPGEIRRAGTLWHTSPVPRLSPTEAVLAYYAELYPWSGSALRGELRAEVVTAEGRSVVATPARALEISAEGGLTRGQLDLTGLPEGSYRLRLRVRLGDSTLVSEAPFAVVGMAAVAAAAPAAQEPRAEEQFFATASEPRLDSLQAPLAYLERDDERGVYGTLSTQGKRRFLMQFWRRRDQTPETPDNPALVEFYRALAYVNEAFRESGAGHVSGWRTDRGRIYLRNGRPDDVLRRPSASPRPYEVWRMMRERARYYVFLDQSGFGHYVLIGTNDRREVGQQEWERLLGPEGYQDVYRFLGLEPARRTDINP